MALDANTVFLAVGAAGTGVTSAFSYMANRRTKVTTHLAERNAEKLDGLANGVMDKKIERAVRKVLDERPELVTKATIAMTLNELLLDHLEKRK